MLFTPDTVDTLEFAIALANTVARASRSGTDELGEPAQLTALLTEHRYSGRFDRDEAELAEVRLTRDEFRRIWLIDRDRMAEEVNTLLHAAGALPQLARHDGLDWHLHATPADAPLAERMRVEVALALSDVIRADATSRLRACAAYDCEGILADLSRNGSKRFCSVRCGNRMNMVAYRERQGED
ncbi:CGNR zinc finger domain-containing protein [Galbitalea soli]|uniref:CGNR zinc finger domain-containing protein n=1 Tax=Galbitalea soli TaxID=1268042 RepID=A0A7C9TRW5_9MICO|nr:CGNR zinc finger domain-containing protein [Galbitalea soli]NEM91602.1 CGNR zinc finger domain-containing protein [Galbitalea soli]NYJ30296.1 hypothetical protein [Galbitalea soli]